MPSTRIWRESRNAWRRAVPYYARHATVALEARPVIVPPPRLSVVIASNNARVSIAECLSTIAAQAHEGVEIIVVDNSTDGTREIIERHDHEIRVIHASPSALIPELWEVGIAASGGDLVAVTTAHCIPAKDWIGAICEAHRGDDAGVGGAIENHEGATLVDWAVYFCRYRQFMLPFERAVVAEIAADNASYKRADLLACRDAWRGGFWEPAVHARLRAEGRQLIVVPEIVVYHRRSFGIGGFVVQRFRHGTEYGRDRASRLSTLTRALHVVSSPAIPILLLLRTVAAVRSRRRHGGELARTLPLLLLFFCAWSVGEVAGYLRGPGA